jgi:methionine-rich copper-binding protein CopC
MFGLRRVLGVALIAATVTVLAATPAAAHNRLVRSDPSAGAMLTAGPAHIAFTFAEPVQESTDYDAIAVTGPGATRWATRNVVVYGDTISADVGALGPAGEYTVAYRIVSADGHPTGGQITVMLTRPGTGMPMSAMTSVAGPTDPPGGIGGVPAWLWLVVVGAIGVFALRATRSRSTKAVRS